MVIMFQTDKNRNLAVSNREVSIHSCQGQENRIKVKRLIIGLLFHLIMAAVNETTTIKTFVNSKREVVS